MYKKSELKMGWAYNVTWAYTTYTCTIWYCPNSVAHSVYGVAQTINSASYMYFLALDKILALGDSRGVEIYTRKGLPSASVCVCVETNELHR